MEKAVSLPVLLGIALLLGGCTQEAVCGNGVCEAGETVQRCALDCSGIVCASYLRKSGSDAMLQGAWTDAEKYTATKEACMEYMQKNILEKPNCGQPDGEQITVLLIDKGKHSLEMPEIDAAKELVHSQKCREKCAENLETTYIDPGFGPTQCCSKNAGIMPGSFPDEEGNCIAPLGGQKGICVDGWRETCGNGECADVTCAAVGCPPAENHCNCPADCSKPEPALGECRDSDGGLDYFEEGWAEDKFGEKSFDQCRDGKTLVERECVFDVQEDAAEYGSVRDSLFDCPNGCENGKCRPLECVDSDNGMGYFEKGTVTGIDGKERTDYCDPPGRKVFEYYCSASGQAAGEWFECPNGCEKGACAE